MKSRFARVLIAVAIAALAVPALAQTTSDSARITYYVQVPDHTTDRFQVRMQVHGLLAPENAILQFASTAPGTYQVMDVGRFVEDLRAVDAEGNEIPVERIATNQWRIGDPTRAREVSYSVAETWDTQVDEHRIYPMAGTSIEADHVLFNAHAVLGFPQGLQGAPVRLDFATLPDWTVGTALAKDAEGFFVAESYDVLVDSPILAGPTLTVERTDVAGVPVEIYTYSAQGSIRSDMLLESMRSMLSAAGAFLGGLPVDRYVFLYHFEGAPQQGAAYGAWEHSYSSEYVFPELPWSEQYGARIKDVAAHEFLHIVTPLNIHSEIIERFNFETPVPSRHLWLYEGVTEWASHMSQLRAGLKSPEEFLEEMARKIVVDRRYFDAETSLDQLALTSYTDDGHRQYGNVYMRGALVAALLDIRLLELSGGERDLQDLLLALMQRYGKSKPFEDAAFYETLTGLTDPAIGEFLDRYVRNAEPLPIAESFAWLGIDFVDEETPRFVIRPNPTPEQARLRDAWLGLSAPAAR